MASSVGKAGQGAVEQFLLLAKSARGKALADLVARATADPGLYGFGELLDLPQIQSLRSTEHAPFVALLELFAYGTWLDYRAASSALPTLSEAQVVKLKQLTVASAAQGAQVVPYADLMAQLEIGTVRELENFLISSCMYGGVLQGSLDQQNGRLYVDDCVSRDLPLAKLPDLIQTLQRWVDTCTAACSELGTTAEETVMAASVAVAEDKAYHKELEARRFRSKGAKGIDLLGLDRGDWGAEVMDTDWMGATAPVSDAAGMKDPRLSKRRR